MATAPRNNCRFSAFSKSEIEQSIPARFEQQASENGTRLAAKMDDHQVTYAELNVISNCIGHMLLESDDRRQNPVAILMNQGISMIAAILGVLKTAKI